MIINTMQHQLTAIQIRNLENSSIGNNDIVSLKEIDNGLFTELANCPADVNKLYELAARLTSIINDKKPEAVILPIGSPAFMFILSKEIGMNNRTRFMFSHTERNSVDEHQPDGSIVKRVVFNHVKWLSV